MKNVYASIICLLLTIVNLEAANLQPIKGKVLSEEGEPLVGATIYIEGTSYGTTTNADGIFSLQNYPNEKCMVRVSYLGYRTTKRELMRRDKHPFLEFRLQQDAHQLKEVEVFGIKDKQPEKMDMITRMPLRHSEQIQSISVISNRLIEEQGNLTLTESVKNVVGVSSFATFGNVQESLTARGFRGIPVLKNGVRVQSDFRGGGFMTDMEGVESIQVIKGSAAVTQGIGNDLGSAGGVVNIATKTPKFYNGGQVSLRTGSWGLFRPTIDVQTVLDKGKKSALRINGAFERGESYRANVSKDRVYINPSFEWRPDERTSLTLEADYMHDSRTPDRGTVNLATDSVNALYTMPHDQFLGFKTDRVFNDNVSYSARFNRDLGKGFHLRAALMGSSLTTANTGATTATLKNVSKTGLYNLRSRSLARSDRKDDNMTLQVDLIGKDLYTGSIKHTFQVGFDYKTSRVKSTSYTSILVDTIDVLKPISNELPQTKDLAVSGEVETKTYSYGLLAQDVITFNRYLKTTLGLRYSMGNDYNNTSKASSTGHAWNPVVGIIVTPLKNIHFFASYTSTTDLRSAANLQADGSRIGEARTDQYEAGVKTEWLNRRLRANLTYFHLNNNNISYQKYNDDGSKTNYYEKAGNLMRRGLEAEVSGRILRNLEVVVGYAYLDAQYRNSPAYYEGSAPMNAPMHTANGWINYEVEKGALRGLSMGAGAYYVGSRPVNDYTYKVTHSNTTSNVKPFDMNAYTTVNLQLGYAYKSLQLRAFCNNVFDALSYNSYYRGGYINPIDPRNFAASLAYTF